MKLSIKQFLLLNLLIGITIAASLTVIGNYIFNCRLGTLLTIVIIYSFLGLMVWFTIHRGLSSCNKIAKALQMRSANNFEPLPLEEPVPQELQPLVNAVNNLLSHLKEDFERNKRFSADAAHELRTPLAALRTQTQLALLSIHNEAEQRVALEKVLQGVDRCSHLIQQLLTLSRLGQTAVARNFHPVNFYKVLADTLAQQAPLAIEKNIELSLLDSDEKSLIFSDETILAILIRNLIDNAIKYTQERGMVQVQIIRESNQLILRIEDNGPGIPPELRSRVFERFYRMLGTKTSGSGLGLAIVQEIVQLHHATIQLDTARSGRGLEIKVYFPIY